MSRPEFTTTVQVRHLPEQSDPGQNVFAFAYTVTVRNTGDIAAQLVARHWVITHANGRIEEVRGLAVVGQQPLLEPGERFDYTSWTRLDTPQGTMQGSFLCVTANAERFDAPVPEFALALPSSLH